jgi:hypothetical protein
MHDAGITDGIAELRENERGSGSAFASLSARNWLASFVSACRESATSPKAVVTPAWASAIGLGRARILFQG